jgi:hypothetical protein
MWQLSQPFRSPKSPPKIILTRWEAHLIHLSRLLKRACLHRSHPVITGETHLIRPVLDVRRHRRPTWLRNRVSRIYARDLRPAARSSLQSRGHASRLGRFHQVRGTTMLLLLSLHPPPRAKYPLRRLLWAPAPRIRLWMEFAIRTSGDCQPFLCQYPPLLCHTRYAKLWTQSGAYYSQSPRSTLLSNSIQTP